MISESVQVKNEVIKEQLYYNKKMILRYKIEYPQFSSRIFQRTLNKINEFYRTKALTYQKYCKNNLYEEAKKQYEDSVRNRYPVRAFDALMTYNLTYNENCIISLYFDKYEYTGGAHGSTVRSSDTWYLLNGRRILLNQFFYRAFNAKEYVLNSINKQIENQIKSGNNIYFENYKENTLKYFNPSSYYLTEKEIVIYYQQYEIAPYVAGIVEFIIPFTDRAVRQPRCR